MRALGVAFVVAGCASSGGAALDAGPSCPAVPPTSPVECPIALQRCVYDRCASSGVIVLTCEASDGGAGTWNASVTPCGTCSTAPCSGGASCIAHAAGAIVAECEVDGCGTGPLACECACGAGVSCAIAAYTGNGPVVTCFTGCGASVCP